jgi:hypothetical protein
MALLTPSPPKTFPDPAAQLSNNMVEAIGNLFHQETVNPLLKDVLPEGNGNPLFVQFWWVLLKSGRSTQPIP